MRIIQTQGTAEMAILAAEIFEDEIRHRPDCVLGLATGATPVPLYSELVSMYKSGRIDFSRVRTINLDEYIGLGAGDNNSFRRFMDDNLFSHINIDPANTHIPDGCAADPESECGRYDRLIEDLGYVDLQLLGIGRNGHIGFNEPAEQWSRLTSVVELTDDTRRANGKWFSSPEEIPRTAITMSVCHIMRARRILLLAKANKRGIIERALNGEITPQVPASALQFHPDVTVIIAEEQA